MYDLNTNICLVCAIVAPPFVNRDEYKTCLECGESRILPLIEVIDLANAYLAETGNYNNKEDD